VSHGYVDDSPKSFGLVAEFDTPEKLISAAEKARLAGFPQLVHVTVEIERCEVGHES
jgi:hypothetical protein